MGRKSEDWSTGLAVGSNPESGKTPQIVYTIRARGRKVGFLILDDTMGIDVLFPVQDSMHRPDESSTIGCPLGRISALVARIQRAYPRARWTIRVDNGRIPLERSTKGVVRGGSYGKSRKAGS